MKVLVNYTEIGRMATKRLSRHQDIIQVYDHKAFEKVEKRLIHQMLKSRGGVGQSKGHNNPFEEAKTSQKCREWLVHWHSLYLVIPLGQVHL